MTQADKKFQQKSIAKKMYRTLAIMIASFGLCLVIAMGGFLNWGRVIRQFYQVSYKTSLAELKMRRDTQSIMKNLLWACTDIDDATRNELLAAAEQDAADQSEQFEFLKESGMLDKEVLADIESQLAEVGACRQELMDAIQSGDIEKAIELADTSYAPTTNKMLEYLAQVGDEAEKEVSSEYTRSSIVSLIIFIAVILSLISGIFITIRSIKRLIRQIVEPIKELEESAREITAGNLDYEITYTSQDELGVLADSFRETGRILKQIIGDLNHIIEEFAKGNFAVESECKEAYVGDFEPILAEMGNMQNIISEIMHSIEAAAEQVSEGSSQLAASAQNVAEGATEQAASVEELMASVSEVTAQVMENTKSTDKVHDKAKVVGQEAINSKQKMSQLMDAMQKISQTSREIEAVIAQIEDIASQTNLLSLNASIEAARAGEAGRGFAVVAQQISSLAEDSANFAGTSKALLEATLKEVDNGNSMTHETSAALNKVVDELDGIIQEVANIRTSSDKQAEEVQEIARGVEHINDVIQTNSATAEENSATSQELSAEAVTLNELVNEFTLK